MESKKYKEFLEHQAGKRPFHKNVSTEKIIFQVSREKMEESSRNESSDILDSVLLGKEMSQSVTVDRRAASLLRYRLDLLEEENLNMRKKIRFMTVIVILMAATIFSLCVYLILRLI
ncbi:TPA: hypothetical protein EYP75_05030 [Candidatus Bathyarchaeota archaeon]|nr:hypothetical protein [Candidatus Bathyarchaeota archaeon]